MYVTDHHDMTIAVKVALNPNTTKSFSNKVSKAFPQGRKSLHYLARGNGCAFGPKTASQKVANILGFFFSETCNQVTIELCFTTGVCIGQRAKFLNKDIVKEPNIA